MIRSKLVIRALYHAGQVCGWLAWWLWEWQRRLCYCEWCGRNKYHGEPCCK